MWYFSSITQIRTRNFFEIFSRSTKQGMREICTWIALKFIHEWLILSSIFIYQICPIIMHLVKPRWFWLCFRGTPSIYAGELVTFFHKCPFFLARYIAHVKTHLGWFRTAWFFGGVIRLTFWCLQLSRWMDSNKIKAPKNQTENLYSCPIFEAQIWTWHELGRW